MAHPIDVNTDSSIIKGYCKRFKLAVSFFYGGAAVSRIKFAVLNVGEWRRLRYRRWQWVTAYLIVWFLSFYMRKPLSVRTAFFVFVKYYIDKKITGFCVVNLMRYHLFSQNSEEKQFWFHKIPKKMKVSFTFFQNWNGGKTGESIRIIIILLF